MQTALKTRIQHRIQAITPFDSLEKDHMLDAVSWIDKSANIFRIEAPDKPPKHLVSYLLPIDLEHKSILLGDHIKAQLWLPPGGHVHLNEDPVQTVLRESQEELRQKALFLKGNDQPFFITVTQTVGLTPGHTDVSLWYLLSGNIHDPIDFERREFTDMTWFTFEEILQSHPAIIDPHMQRFTRKLVDYLS
jgi:8-oxo-dGTP pyrophosphatase MutT (NUDIX family)